MDRLVAWASPEHLLLTAVLLLARGVDFLSTWIATPTLRLEANPLVRLLGWRGSVVLNLGICIIIGVWPFPTIILITTSLLVAARNFQSAWISHSMGEEQYHLWLAERLRKADRLLTVVCFVAQATCVAAVGAALVWFGRWELVPVGIGVGVLVYALAVLLFTLNSLRRLRRSRLAENEYVFPE